MPCRHGHVEQIFPGMLTWNSRQWIRVTQKVMTLLSPYPHPADRGAHRANTG